MSRVKEATNAWRQVLDNVVLGRDYGAPSSGDLFNNPDSCSPTDDLKSADVLVVSLITNFIFPTFQDLSLKIKQRLGGN